MAVPSIPQGVSVSQANGEVYISWSQVAGATSYSVQSSTDNVTFAALGTSSLTNYTDTTVVIGTQYFYTVAGVNVSGTGSYSNSQSAIPAPAGEMSLAQIRLASQQRADLVNSQFITTTEWNQFINLAMFELYDIIITVYEDYFIAAPTSFQTNGSDYQYALPNGTNYNKAPALYKLRGVDLAINTASNAWVSIQKFNFIDRNKFVYPNTNSTIYGVFNLRYRMLGDKIEFIPTPSANQTIRLWYVPRLQELLADTDITTIGISGWLNYVIVRAAKYALDKEESDTANLSNEITFIKTRIEESASNRDAGQPDTISDVRGSNYWGMNGPFDGNSRGGF